MKPNRPTVADLAKYDEIIDVRTPAEFAEDHIPGAINCPVLDNEQRIQVGTLYKQVSPFEAKKIGAALVSENIARHLKESFLDRPKSWKPLIYCWRGGDRSGSMTTIFKAIGWQAGQLDGGYKAWRSHVIAQLEELPQHYHFIVIGGATGSAKTRILQAIGALGEQVLDLENLANHKGSVLGVLPDSPQPSQKGFETSLMLALAALDPARPVYVEAESRKIGNLHVPEAMIERIRSGEFVAVDATLDARVAFLLKDYDYFLTLPEFLCGRLDALRTLQSRETLDRWQQLIRDGDWPTLVRELLEQHYDPLYQRSQDRNYTGLQNPGSFSTDDLSEDGIQRLAAAIVQSRTAQIA
ncbi:tRNA 2-selenouridine(34) synthase MnmH [Ferribacterium limneticum]|uniref:tRNA 2-selenouridine(34) synthase MnmH n=1 Tax=Ferribacterium limneticum TaxID=76259 RepID=UPI001CF9507F|nr:tRNA 2-selenouridine(34) synthase MnmH [Ferribacterium limneticum]UCV29927.1 tRNA 2-selenouridine(34) synthase MnmH [Ferribacterium limneticum]UCV33846.1 tRNA 2-selenouridine(34) synthase MnmH [Ferribacterium limneticum]